MSWGRTVLVSAEDPRADVFEGRIIHGVGVVAANQSGLISRELRQRLVGQIGANNATG